MDIFSDIATIREDLLSGRVTATERIGAVFEHVDRVEPRLHSFLSMNREGALEAADAIDQSIRAGRDPGVLAGVPVAVKDNLATRGLRTTAASKMLEGYVPVYDSHVVEQLRDSGALIVGKTNMDEFAMGSSTENSAFGVTGNPWDAQRVPGGSSGGTAAAVGSGQACIGLGSDTGGSIRQPAALCGIVGLKPTWERVSRYGLIAFASSLDQVGPMTRTVRDCAQLLQVIAGYDSRDSTCVDLPVPDYLEALDGDIKGLRIGVPAEYFGDGIDPEVDAAVRTALQQLVDAGAHLESISLAHTPYCLSAYYLIAPAEASSNLARYDGVRYGLRVDDEDVNAMITKTRAAGFGPEVKRRIMLGTYALSAGYYDAFYGTAQRVRTLVRQDIVDTLKTVDVIATPTSPVPACNHGERTSDPLAMYLMDICTISANLAGVPALSQLCGFTRSGLPIGLQFLGRPFDEEQLLRVAHAYESRTDWHQRRPAEVAGDKP